MHYGTFEIVMYWKPWKRHYVLLSHYLDFQAGAGEIGVCAASAAVIFQKARGDTTEKFVSNPF